MSLFRRTFSVREQSGMIMADEDSPVATDELQDEVAAMGLEAKPEDEIDGQTEVASGPSKSAKKKAKKKAAAARKGDGTENGEADGLEAAGINGGVDDSPEANGAEPGGSDGTASKKKKAKERRRKCRQTLQQYLLRNCFLEALLQKENGNHTRMSRFCCQALHVAAL
ncbi:TPA: hypothetical protein ACH3X2_002893 [Trebouxia sp. C0005]